MSGKAATETGNEKKLNALSYVMLQIAAMRYIRVIPQYP
jgi:hypothetical protein